MDPIVPHLVGLVSAWRTVIDSYRRCAGDMDYDAGVANGYERALAGVLDALAQIGVTDDDIAALLAA